MAENRRTATRHEVDLPITLVLIGMKRLPMGERVNVTFTVPNQDEPITAAATVRWSTDDSVGVQFDGLRAKDVWALNKYFEQLQSA